jgi:hypothetical protein
VAVRSGIGHASPGECVLRAMATDPADLARQTGRLAERGLPAVHG